MEGLNTLGTFFHKELAGETFPQELLAGEIAHLTVNRQERLVRVEARFPAFVEYGDLQRLSKVLEGPALGLPCVKLEPRFPAECFSAQCVPSLVAAVKELDACLNGTFKQAEANLNGSTLSISLAHGGYDLLAARGTGEKLQGLIQAWFGVACQVEFTGKRTVAQGRSPSSSGCAPRRSSASGRPPSRRWSSTRRPCRSVPAAGRSASGTRSTCCPPSSPRPPGPCWALCPRENHPPGRGHPGRREPGGLGEIISLESKETRDKSRKIYSIDITDYTGSTTVKLLQDAGDCQALDKLKAGQSLLVRGALEYDKYDRENVMRARAIATVDQVEVVDDAPEKRVELHLHTNMSDMDGMTPAAALIKQAHKWGQKAIAITDHGVAQAFPEAMTTAEAIRKEDPDFKVIYGTEAYFVNDLVPAVAGDSAHPLTGDFICFDLETTGLSPHSDRITEIGAVRIHNGEITENSTPSWTRRCPSREDHKLTSITNEMVAGAPKEAEALEQFFQFCGEDAVLVAHNAGFDAGFVRAALQRQGKPFENTYIDTVTMARSLLPDLNKATLDSVANYLKLKPFHHHRPRTTPTSWGRFS